MMELVNHFGGLNAWFILEYAIPRCVLVFLGRSLYHPYQFGNSTLLWQAMSNHELLQVGKKQKL